MNDLRQRPRLTRRRWALGVGFILATVSVLTWLWVGGGSADESSVGRVRLGFAGFDTNAVGERHAWFEVSNGSSKDFFATVTVRSARSSRSELGLALRGTGVRIGIEVADADGPWESWMICQQRRPPPLPRLLQRLVGMLPAGVRQWIGTRVLAREAARTERFVVRGPAIPE